LQHRKVRGGLTGVLALAAILTAAPSALANTTKSTNWAGYAVHRAGVSFRQISGSWTQPSATCVAGHPSYSSAWVGLGGYSPTSDALEQIGTEIDCDAAGQVVSSAWYELVPAPSKTISLAVQPGDAMHASVTVTGHHVAVELDDLTTHQSFHKSLHTAAIDVSSAEWIVEAPSQCISQFACQALPLANFGSVSFDSAAAVATNGSAGTIASSVWGRTKIKLSPGSQALIVSRSSSDSAGAAAPSALRADGSAFDVTYAVKTVQARSAVARASSLRAGYIQH
jgi:Peptidase A4 family